MTKIKKILKETEDLLCDLQKNEDKKEVYSAMAYRLSIILEKFYLLNPCNWIFNRRKMKRILKNIAIVNNIIYRQ